MKPGDQIICPHCGRSSFLKKESVMNGWSKVGEALKCVACSATIEEIKPPSPLERRSEESAGVSKLASLLGTQPVAKPKLEAKASERNFCRDCANLVAHPFLCHCALHNKDVNPMDDCPDFKPKQRKS